MSVHTIYYKDGAKMMRALASEFNGFPMRLRKVLDILSLDGFYSKELRNQGVSPTSIKLQETFLNSCLGKRPFEPSAQIP